MANQLAEIYRAAIVPVLFGLILMMVVIQALIYWQMQREWHVVSFFVLFVSLTWLYLVAALQLSTAWREVGRIGFGVGLLGSNYFRGRELVLFLRAKRLRGADVHQ